MESALWREDQVDKANRKMPGGYLLQIAQVKRVRESVTPVSTPAVQRAMTVPQLTPFRELQSILRQLHQHKLAGPFRRPVDTKHYKDYRDFVKKPMDLATVTANLAKGKYATARECEEDVRQIWKNAFIYNRPNTDVYIMAETLSDFFEERLCAYRGSQSRHKRRVSNLVQAIWALGPESLSGVFAIVEPLMSAKDGVLDLSVDVNMLPAATLKSLELFVESAQQSALRTPSTACSFSPVRSVGDFRVTRSSRLTATGKSH